MAGAWSRFPPCMFASSEQLWLIHNHFLYLPHTHGALLLFFLLPCTDSQDDERV